MADLGGTICLTCMPLSTVRDRVRTKMERDILADVNHPFVVKLHYGECGARWGQEQWHRQQLRCLEFIQKRNELLS